jgi:hypothetical protein
VRWLTNVLSILIGAAKYGHLRIESSILDSILFQIIILNCLIKCSLVAKRVGDHLTKCKIVVIPRSCISIGCNGYPKQQFYCNQAYKKQIHDAIPSLNDCKSQAITLFLSMAARATLSVSLQSSHLGDRVEEN